MLLTERALSAETGNVFIVIKRKIIQEAMTLRCRSSAKKILSSLPKRTAICLPTQKKLKKPNRRGKTVFLS